MLGLLIAPSYCLAEWHTAAHDVMGTRLTITLWHKNKDTAEQLIDTVVEEMNRLENKFSSYKEDSELSNINHHAFKQAVPVSDEMLAVLDKALYYGQLTGGAFDISFASVGRQYDYRTQQKPLPDQINAAIINFKLIELDKNSSTVRFLHPHIRIALGGIVKGYAVDRAAQILHNTGISNASVSAGGDSRILGNRNGQPWMVGIKHPRARLTKDQKDVALVIPLENAAMSASGDYERYFIDQISGERVHHIINPKTKQSATGVRSVSIIGPQGFDTDPLSTSVFVMGVQDGLQLINRLQMFDAVIIDHQGKVHYSNGLVEPN